jgi:hypothetical protein
MIPALPTAYGPPQQEPDFLSTAFDLYTDALLAPKPIEGAIASAVACLEALCLSDNPDPGEITLRLVQRVALLLGRYGWPPSEIKKMLKVAYNVRSRYVHGSVPNPKKRLSPEQLVQIFRATTDHARLACLVIVQMTKIHNKDNVMLLKALDDAMIDDAARKQLDDWCSVVKFGQNPKALSA